MRFLAMGVLLLCSGCIHKHSHPTAPGDGIELQSFVFRGGEKGAIAEGPLTIYSLLVQCPGHDVTFYQFVPGGSLVHKVGQPPRELPYPPALPLTLAADEWLIMPHVQNDVACEALVFGVK